MLSSRATRGAAYDALLILYRNPAFPTSKREVDPKLEVDLQWLIHYLRDANPVAPPRSRIEFNPEENEP